MKETPEGSRKEKGFGAHPHQSLGKWASLNAEETPESTWMASPKPTHAYVTCQGVFKERKGREVLMHQWVERF